MKVKKIFAIAMALCTITTAGLLGGCQKHTHKFTEWVVTTPATCTDDGEMTRYCKDDNYEEKAKINKLGHSYGEWEETTHPSCTLQGEKTRECSRCGDIEKEKVNELGHEFSPTWSVSDKKHYHLCIRCSERSGEDDHVFDLEDGNKCSVCNYLKSASDIFAITENVDGASCTITGFREDVVVPEEITIPDEIGSKTVTAIADNAFSKEGPSTFKKINFSNNIKKIGKQAFKGNVNLTELVLPQSLEVIDDSAFWGCTSIQNIQFNDKLKTIGESSFWQCQSINNLDMPDSLESVGMYAFCYCTGIESLKFKDNFKYLGYQSFYGCTQLESVDLGNGELVAERYAFQQCTSLTKVTIGDRVQEFGYGVFYNAPVVYNVKDKVSYIGNEQSQYIVAISGDMDITSYTSEPETRVISDSAFYQRNELSTVVLGDNVRCIDMYAFSACESLTSVTFGAGLKKVKLRAFEYSSSIETVNAASVESWLNIQFLPDMSDLLQLEYQGAENPLFYGAALKVDGEDVTVVNVPDGITSISKFAFVNYNHLENINIGKDVAEIGDYAFKNCSGIRTITVAQDNQVYEGGGNCIIESDTKTLIMGCSTSEIPNGVITIAAKVFRNVEFENPEITIPNTVQSIEEDAFNGSVLEKIHMGTGVKTIGEYAFSLSSKKINPTIYIEDLKNWCSIDFTGGGANPMQPGSAIYVNGTLVSGYNTDEGLVIPGSITEIKPWAFYNSFIIKFSIPKETTKIASTAFAHLPNLQSITVDDQNPVYHTINNNRAIVDDQGTLLLGCGGNVDLSRENITKIGDYAFADKVVTTLVLPNNLKEIGECAFNWARLKEVTLPTGLTKIGAHAFESNRDLKIINIPGGVEEISDFAFNDCLSLESITINDGVKKIGEQAFASSMNAVTDDTENLISVELPSSIQEIGDYAFWYRTKLQTISLKEGITKIGGNAFGECKALTTLTIPASVNYLGATIVSGCESLQSVNFLDKTSSWVSDEENSRTIKFDDPSAAVQELQNSSVFNWTKQA